MSPRSRPLMPAIRRVFVALGYHLSGFQPF